LVEEAAAAAESMQEQAQMLAQAVSIFKLSNDQQDSRRPAAPAQRSAPARAAAPARATTPAPRVTASKPAAPKKLSAAASDEWEEF
jgi:methyl-accepting chemotaxis protein